MTATASHLDALSAGLGQIAQDLPGRLGVSVRFLDWGLGVDFEADALFPAASVIKVPIMVTVYQEVARGALAMDEVLPLLQEEIVDGSGVLQFLHPGLPLTVADALELMIGLSDNTATNLLLRRIGTETVNAAMQELGLTETRSAGPIRKANAVVSLRQRSRTTPREMAALLARIAAGTVIDGQASTAMVRTLERNVYTDMLPRYLPVTHYPDRTGDCAGPVRIAHKTGALSGARHDAGIISALAGDALRSVVVAAFTADVADGELWTAENPASRAVAEVGWLCYRTLLHLAGEA